MKTHIDRFGRIVIPRKLRERMHLQAGDEVDISEENGKLHIEPSQPENEEPVLIRNDNGLLVLRAKWVGPEYDPIARDREERMRKILGL